MLQLPRRLRQRPLTGNNNGTVCGANIRLRYRSFYQSSVVLLSSSLWLKIPEFRWNFDASWYSCRDLNTSGFSSYIANPGCRSMLQSHRDKLFDLAVVQNLPLKFWWHHTFGDISTCIDNVVVSLSSGIVSGPRWSITRKMSYRKDDRAMSPIIWVSWKFSRVSE